VLGELLLPRLNDVVALATVNAVALELLDRCVPSPR
jgi:hypothetical protein